MSVLLSVDTDSPSEWMAQLQILCAVVDGPIERITVAPLVEAVG